MFCQNCGAKNDDDAVFCGECGAKLEKEEAIAESNPVVQETVENSEREEEQTFVYRPLNEGTTNADNQQFGQKADFGSGQQNTASLDLKNMDRLTLVCVIEAVVLIIVAIVFFQVGKKMTSPQHIAEKYFVAEMSCDVNGVYSTLDIESDDEFLTKKALEKSMSGEKPEKLKNYNVRLSDTTGIQSTVDIEYIDKDGDVNVAEITLTKDKKKKLFFFDKWKIASGSRIVSNYYVYAPKGAKINIDGVNLSNKYASQEDGDDNTDVYVIPYIFSGDHDVKMSIGDLSEFEQVANADVYGANSFSFQNFKLDEKTQKKLVNLAYSDMMQIANAAYADSPFSSIEGLYKKDKDIRESAKYDYEYLTERFSRGEDDYGITAATFKEVSGYVDEVYYSDGEIVANVELDYTYDASYRTSGWFQEPTGVSEENDSICVQFVYTNGNWVLNSDAIPYLSY